MTIASMPVSGSPTVLPVQDDFARAFYLEAVRHLGDARILHKNERYAAAITSTMKAAEFAVKAAFILEGGLGFLEKVFSTHKPLIEAANHPLFKKIEVILEGFRVGLSTDVKVIEALAPKPFGADKFAADETNTEYPFLETAIHVTGYTTAQLVSPHFRFSDSESRKHFLTAREVILFLPTFYSGRLPRKVRLPFPL